MQSQSNVNVRLINDRIISDISVYQCAKSCVEMEGGSCATFAYCSKVSECRLSTSALSNVGQTGPDAVATCNVYSSKSVTTRDRSRNFSGISDERQKPNSNVLLSVFNILLSTFNLHYSKYRLMDLSQTS